MLLTLYRIRYSNHRQIRRKSLAGQQDCIHQRHHPAPNFGKTAGVLKIPIEAAGYENAKGFSEIGGRGQGPGIPIALVSQRFMDI